MKTLYLLFIVNFNYLGKYVSRNFKTIKFNCSEIHHAITFYFTFRNSKIDYSLPSILLPLTIFVPNKYLLSKFIAVVWLFYLHSYIFLNKHVLPIGVLQYSHILIAKKRLVFKGDHLKIYSYLIGLFF